MPDRQVERTASFANDLKALSKKHPALGQRVDEALAEYAANGKSHTSHQIPYLNSLPVFKDRLAFGDRGKRGAARIIYFCDQDRVLALFLYTKGQQSDVPRNEIRAALKSAGLWEPPSGDESRTPGRSGRSGTGR